MSNGRGIRFRSFGRIKTCQPIGSHEIAKPLQQIKMVAHERAYQTAGTAEYRDDCVFNRFGLERGD